MPAPKSPFERSLSKRILFFAYLMPSSVSGAKALKKHVCDLPYSISVKRTLQNIFEIGLRKCGLIIQKSLLNKKYFEIKNSETRFCKTSCQNLRAIEQIPFDL